MSENYGPCKRCKGEGEITILRKCPVLHTTYKKVVECTFCTGTGFDGSAEGYAAKEEARHA